MQLVSVSTDRDAAATEGDASFAGTSLVVVFAQADELARVRGSNEGTLALCPPFHVGEEDAYLVLPDDIGEEIVDILRDGDAELLAEALRDGLLALGTVARNPRGRGMVLEATFLRSPREWLEHSSTAYAATLCLGGGRDLLRELNTLPHVQCTTLSALADDEGLEQMLREGEYIGPSWRPPASAKRLQDIEPTYVWSRKRGDGAVGIELALFREDEELVALLRPACLRLA